MVIASGSMLGKTALLSTDSGRVQLMAGDLLHIGLWDSGIRKALKIAAQELNIDFPGFGMHSFRRGMVTKFQEAGGSAIEAQKTAGHSRVETTSEYTILQWERQEGIIRRVQERWKEEQQAPGPVAPAAAVAGWNSARFCDNSVPRRGNLMVIPGGKGK
jgi:hypothetical protein